MKSRGVSGVVAFLCYSFGVVAINGGTSSVSSQMSK
jgi:hypothetical protein